MSSIYHEDFDGGGGGDGTFLALGGTPPIVSGGDPGNCVRFDPNTGYYRDLSSTYATLRFSFSLKVDSNFRPNGQIITLANAAAPNTPNTAQAMANLHFEPDRSLSVYISGVTRAMANSQTIGGYAYGTGEWFRVQWIVVMTDVLVSGIHYVHFKTTLAINGNAVFTDIEATSTINALTQPSGAMGSNLQFWQGAGQGFCYADNIVADTDSSVDTTASTGQEFNSQMVIEPVEVPTDATGIVSQLAIELPEEPTTSPVLITQMVIELPGQIVPAAGGWKIYEA